MKKILLFLALSTASLTQAQIISTIAGSNTGVAGYSGDGGPATAALLNTPYDICTDAAGNYYIPDGANNVIRKVNTAGIISTYAGTGISGYTGDGGAATIATLSRPTGVFFDNTTSDLYIADEQNNVVRKVSASGAITTIAGTGIIGYSGDYGPATAATLHYPYAVLKNGPDIFIADRANNCIRKINASGIITTYAGTGTAGFAGDGGPATAARLDQPVAMCIGPSGNMYFTDWNNNRVRKITPGGIVSTVIGNGTLGAADGVPATSTGLATPYGVAVDCHENLYVAEYTGYKVHRVNTSGIISTIAGTGTFGYSGDGGAATAATFRYPYGLIIDAQGNLIVSDQGNNSLRKITSPAPTPVVTGASRVCASFTVTLTASIPGGTWGVRTGHTSVSGSGLVTGLTGGVDTITYTLCSSPIASFPVTVDAAASAGTINGPDTVCVGATILLTDAVAGGAWTSSTPSVATVTSGTVAGVAAGVATITYSVTNACGPATAFHTVTVMPLPSVAPISGPTVICGDHTITLTDATPGGTWSLSNAHASMTIPGSLAGSSPGVDTVYYTVTNACGSTTVRQLDTIMTAPTVTAITGPSNLCKDSVITLTDTTAGGIWTSVTTTIATVNATGHVTGHGAGIDTIKYSLTNACGSAIATMVVHVTICDSSAGVDPLIAQPGKFVIIYPNPNNGTFRITGMLTGTSAETISLQVLDLVGNTLYSNTYTTTGRLDEIISIPRIPKGKYFVSISTASQRQMIQINIE